MAEGGGLWIISKITDDPVRITPAQVALLDEISKGKLPHEAAEALGIKPNTAYTQLARVAEHLGTRTWFETYLVFSSGRHDLPTAKMDLQADLGDLDIAEAKLRRVMFLPYVNSNISVAVPWLLEALSLVNQVRMAMKKALPVTKGEVK